MGMVKKIYFDAPIRYNETEAFKEELIEWVSRQGKDLSEWIRNACRQQLKTEKKEREKDYLKGIR